MKSPESIVERYCAAVASTDVEALMSLYSSDARIFDMTEPWEHQGLEEWRSKVSTWFSDVGEMNSTAEASRIEQRTSDSLVLLTMFMRYQDTDENGEHHGMTNRLTWVLTPVGDDWKILHEHTSAPLTEDMANVVYEP